MVSVTVSRTSTGEPVESIRVSIGFDGLLRGFSEEAYTDSTGQVHFNCDPGDGEIFIDGMSKYKGKIQGNKIIYI